MGKALIGHLTFDSRARREEVAAIAEICLVCLSLTFLVAALEYLTEATCRRGGRLISPQSLRGSQPIKAEKAWWPKYAVGALHFFVCLFVLFVCVYICPS